MSSPTILALDCSTEYCSVALLDGETIFAQDEHAGQRHSERVLAMVDAVLTEATVKLKDLSAIAFGSGPGSFTGLRIAAGVAQGLAFGANVPVIPIPTLLALAQTTQQERVLAVLDARMGEVYAAAYERVGGEWRTVFAPCLCKPNAVPSLPDGLWNGVGSGFAAYGKLLKDRFTAQLATVDATSFPHAREIARLALHRLHEACPAEQALPLYIRDKVALTESERGVGK
jgi:tRNA threonylcarbamoyladenosine biosynthesis protein TsaB